jgi:DNA mismatch repair protein MutL
MTGRFPAFVLHIEMPYDSVDVNVHPAKIEVRFINERPIFDAVYTSVKNALFRHEGGVPLRLSSAAPNVPPMGIACVPPPYGDVPFTTPRIEFTELSPSSAVSQPFPQIPLAGNGSNDTLDGSFFPEAGVAVDSAGSPVSVPVEMDPFIDHHGPQRQSPRFLGEAFETYILVQQSSTEIRVIDKHAAHERLIYNRLIADKKSYCQQLLAPLTVTLEKEDYSVITENLQKLEEEGIEAEDFGSGAILVRGIPVELDGNDIRQLIGEVAAYLRKNKNDLTDRFRDWLYHNISCRAAIKAGDKSSPLELASLIDQLGADPDAKYCPHGRPVFFKIMKKDLEKQFGRA